MWSPTEASDEALLRVHSQTHLTAIARAAEHQDALDPDTGCVSESERCARRAAGALVDAVDAVLAGDDSRAFCSVRPPGHHARPGSDSAHGAMGFCLYSSVAVGAEHALSRGLSRVAILDFDVHHGNGTQDAFYDRDDVLFVSWHQYPHYPGTGAAEDRGAGEGLGKTLNCPMPRCSDDSALLRLFDDEVRPALLDHQPEIILVSAGFDGDTRDPLAELELGPSGYAQLTEKICALADEVCSGRVVSTLEGGYDLEALGEDLTAHVEVLIG